MDDSKAPQAISKTDKPATTATAPAASKYKYIGPVSEDKRVVIPGTVKDILLDQLDDATIAAYLAQYPGMARLYQAV
jgi:hypothetical protein